jgi:1-acyl-sn-glycerol-3-phosphate acyltransferase
VPLSTTERLIGAIAGQVNQRPLLKRASHAYLKALGMNGVHLCTRRLLRVTNGDALDALPVDRGVLVASNHRSFFDMYVVSSVLLRRCGWIRRLYFPVRSDYFYDRLGGLCLNGLVSAMSMYPPVYRDAARRPLNRDMVSFVVDELQRPGTIVGIHPEGQRSRHADPYTLLPAQPGLGDIVHRARPVVLPVFILGLRNDLAGQIRDNFSRTGPPITVTFGAPLALDAYLEAPRGRRQSLRIAQAVRAGIEALGHLDRQARRSASDGATTER